MAGHSAGTEIERLIQLLSRLPGLGPRSARRAALQLLGKKETLMRPLADALQDAADRVLTCSVCGNLDTSDPCTICADTRRDKGVICVVEQVADLWALERAGANAGQYHVLGGTLSALDGVGPDDLNISGLVTRVSGGDVREVVLALNATVDGQATAHYITDQLEGSGANVSQVAHGVPVGGELDYLDDGTLAAAMKARRPF
ncbi:recombination mediator RecR [Pyruvatibacter mobilis]|uniref:recombination mediator RecR n=1 Tax=Pyruvatibacter mobilis TaxID=1712261 RepID=UPI003BAE5996